MKKFFFFAAMAGVALVGCVKNEPVEVAKQAEITFASPVVGLNTKAAEEVWNNYPTDHDFKVYARHYDETYTTWDAGFNYMNGVVVNHANGTWAPATPYYWPNGTLTFIAYAPSSVAATINASGVNFADYTIPTDATKQQDLLFSERAYNKTASNVDETVANGTTGSTEDVVNDPYKGVHIAFKHALSSIVFSARTKYDYAANGTTVTLTGISISKIGSMGDFTEGITDGNNAASNASWGTPEAVATYSVTADKALTTTAYWTAFDLTQATVPSDVKDGHRNTDFILLPQTLSVNAGEEAMLTVNYTLKHKDQTEALAQTASVVLSHDNVREWIMGKRYIYNIIIDLGTHSDDDPDDPGVNDGIITFEPFVTDWVDVTPGVDFVI